MNSKNVNNYIVLKNHKIHLETIFKLYFCHLKLKFFKIMKKLLLFGLGVIASLSTLTSCKKDEVVVAAPTITFLNGVNQYTASASDLNYTFVADVVADGEIASIKIFEVKTDGTEIQDSLITKFDSDTKHAVKYTVKLADVVTSKKFKITVTDKKDVTTSAVFTITAFTKPAGAIKEYTATLLGSQYAATGSFFSSTNGQVYTVNTSAANSSLIDLIYYYSGTNGASIGGADDINISNVYKVISNWTTKNATRFSNNFSMSITDFDAIKDDSKIEVLTTFTYTKKIALAEGNVIAFMTAAGKKGLVKITKITKGYNTVTKLDDYQWGTIEIVVKVQK